MTRNHTPLRYLYVFPHPDDESFGPALVMSKQRREGHEVHLVTLTRGGATKQRHELGLSVQEMGAIRAREMERVREVLGLETFALHDLPDGGLKDRDPLELEELVEAAMRRVRPDVVVTYAVQGVSGHPDHLVTHAVVKRVFAAGRAAAGLDELRRLALFTLLDSGESETGPNLNTSPPSEIGAVVRVDDEDIDLARRALACYETYREVIESHRPLERIGREVPFELFGESFDPPLGSLSEKLPD